MGVIGGFFMSGKAVRNKFLSAFLSILGLFLCFSCDGFAKEFVSGVLRTYAQTGEGGYYLGLRKLSFTNTTRAAYNNMPITVDGLGKLASEYPLEARAVIGDDGTVESINAVWDVMETKITAVTAHGASIEILTDKDKGYGRRRGSKKLKIDEGCLLIGRNGAAVPVSIDVMGGLRDRGCPVLLILGLTGKVRFIYT
jgi:hypothetical protein